MNLVYIRFAFYFIAPMLGTLPGVEYDEMARQIIIDIEAASVGIGASLVASSAIFWKWGKK